MRERGSLSRGRGWATLTLMFLAAATAGAEVKIEREGKGLKSITVQSAAGKVHIKRATWGNTTLTTESGKVIPVVDPFMYLALAKPGGGKQVGGYWTKPEIFDAWKVEQVKAPGKPGMDIVKIAAQQPGMPLRKELTIAVEAKENVAYVYNRLTALADTTLIVDNQVMWFNNVDLYEFHAEGKMLRADDDRRVHFRRWATVHHSNAGWTVGVVGVRQGPKQGILANMHFRANPKLNGAEVSWPKLGGEMKKGDTRVQQYILVWGDGDLKDKVAAIAEKAKGGELKGKFHALPKP